MKVIEFPLSRITISFILGIIIAYYYKINIEYLAIILFTGFLTFTISFFYSKRRNVNPIIFGLSTYLLAFIIGLTTQVAHTESNQKNNYINYKNLFEKTHELKVTVREKLRSSQYNDRYIVLVKKINDSEASGRILLNIRKDSLEKPLKTGVQLKINGMLIENGIAKNPNQFDYGKYLENKQIYAQIYSEYSAIKISLILDKNVWHYASSLRTTILSNLKKNKFSEKELNVAAALILGQQQDISPDIIKDYQYAGAVHILSVSGLHIGFILLFVTFILKPFPNTRRGAFIKLIIIILSLISFGIIAGLAPSVVRSVVMFSFVAIGMYLRRSTNIFHTLLVSMLLILLFQPSFLFDVGFQLSYIALFFILWLQPLLAELWKPKNKVVNYFWEILTVSFAAQIGAFPLSIYYFHQFPGLFFVTNLVVIPFISLIMALGVLVMVLAAFDYVPMYLSKSLEWSIFILNKIINSIASIKQFIIQDIPFNWYLLISFYLLIISSIIWLKKPNFKRLVLTLISVLILQITYFETNWIIQKQKELVIFNSKKKTLISVRNGENVTLYERGKDLKNQTINSYLMGNFSELKAIKKLENLLFFNGNKILILDSLGVYPKNTNPDILILTQSPKINLERLFQKVKPKMVVADATNFKTYIKHWKATCIKKKIPFHATGEKGFYRLN
jgi:competence protein ComEC